MPHQDRCRPISLLASLALIAATAGCGGGGSHVPDDASYCDVISDYASEQDCADFQKQAARMRQGTAAFNAPNPLERGEPFTVWLAVAADAPEPEPTPTTTSAPDPTGGEETPAATESAATESPEQTPAPTETPSGPQADVAPRPEEVIASMPGHPERFSLTVGEHVAAVLGGGEAFKIEPRSEQTQRVALDEPYPSTVWQWDVTPLRGGTHAMTITTIVQAKDRNGAYHEISSTPRSYSFEVKVGWAGMAEDALEQTPVWIKLLTAVFVALAALIAAVKSVRDGVLDLLGIKRKPKPEKPAAPEAAKGPDKTDP